MKQGTIIVTGGASGIGAATARSICADGGGVVLVDVQRDAAERLAEELRASGARADAISADVRDEESVRVAFAEAAARAPVVGLVTCAGVAGELRPVEELSGFGEVFAVNVAGTMHAVKHAVPLLTAAGGGSIVCVASAAAFVGTPRLGAYAATKGAIVSFAKCAAVELAPRGIRVNTVCPGFVETPMTADVAVQRGGSAHVTGSVDNVLGRASRPDEIGSAIAFLLSDRSSFMVGSDLVIDGGKLAR
jgi:NAD(P)-dependent dehydrogenase (short-subunit alcohol dehydrogenase family)